MEMEFKDTDRSRRILLIVVGVVLAGAAGWGAFMLANGKSNAAPVVTEAVLVAARDIPARQQVAADDVTVRQVPIDEVLPQSYKEAALVVGRLTAVPVYSDQQMTPNLFATSTADTDFSILGPDDEVTLDFALLASRLRRGSGQSRRWWRAQGRPACGSRRQRRYPGSRRGQRRQLPEHRHCHAGRSPEWQVDQDHLPGRRDPEGDPDNSMYVLKVDLHQAEEIGHVIQMAPDSFTMVLRPETDTRAADTTDYGTTTDRLVMTYLYPVPQLIDLSALLGTPITPTAPDGVRPGTEWLTAPGESPAASPEPRRRQRPLDSGTLHLE